MAFPAPIPPPVFILVRDHGALQTAKAFENLAIVARNFTLFLFSYCATFLDLPFQTFVKNIKFPRLTCPFHQLLVTVPLLASTTDVSSRRATVTAVATLLRCTAVATVATVATVVASSRSGSGKTLLQYWSEIDWSR